MPVPVTLDDAALEELLECVEDLAWGQAGEGLDLGGAQPVGVPGHVPQHLEQVVVVDYRFLLLALATAQGFTSFFFASPETIFLPCFRALRLIALTCFSLGFFLAMFALPFLVLLADQDEEFGEAQACLTNHPLPPSADWPSGS